VDFALKPYKAPASTALFKRFNPCFGGFCSKTPEVQKIHPDFDLFQSLFWWILL